MLDHKTKVDKELTMSKKIISLFKKYLNIKYDFKRF